jgi:hypothetical protein
MSKLDDATSEFLAKRKRDDEDWEQNITERRLRSIMNLEAFRIRLAGEANRLTDSSKEKFKKTVDRMLFATLDRMIKTIAPFPLPASTPVATTTVTAAAIVAAPKPSLSQPQPLPPAKTPSSSGNPP